VSGEADTGILVASVRFQQTGKLYDFDARGCADLRVGDYVLVDTTRGQQIGQVAAIRTLKTVDKSLKPVLRRATGRELVLRQKWQQKEQEAKAAAEAAVRQLKLPIKVVLAEYTFDGSRLAIVYATEEKKPHLESLKEKLEQELNVHVELRRVGPRDHAKLMGGYGACGELRCCSRFISEFCPVSIKMAKTQGMSLNPEDITGMCGRLRCCLAYEQEQYEEATRLMPRRKKRVRTPYGEGKVIDLLPLKGIVVVQIEDHRLEVPLEDVELI